jgi:hypothetical protein
MVSKCKLCLIPLAVFLAVVPVYAQSGLTPDQLAALSRASAAADALNQSSSYVETTISTEHFSMLMTIGEQHLAFTTDTAVERTSSVILGASPNIRSVMTAQVQDSNAATGINVNYTLKAEARLVSGVLYVLAERTPAEGTTLPLDMDATPTGWTRIDNLEDWPGLDPLSLSDLLDMGSGTTQDTPFNEQDIALLQAISPAVTVQPVSWKGAQADEITLSIQALDLLSDAGKAFMGSEDSSLGWLDASAAYLSDNDLLSAAVTLSPDNQLLRSRLNMSLSMDGVDAAVIDPTIPAGSTFNFVAEENQTTKFSDINQPLTPVEAPPL